MIIKDKSRDQKLQYNIDREAAKNLALLSRKVDEYEFLQEKKYYLPVKVG